jgi:hypothetical protein
VAVVLLNIGETNATITATWADVGLEHGVEASVMDLFAGHGHEHGGSGSDVRINGSISAAVGPHDCAAFRLTPVRAIAP